MMKNWHDAVNMVGPAAVIAVSAAAFPAADMFAGAMLVVGLPLRRAFLKLNDFFEEQLEKTGYM